MEVAKIIMVILPVGERRPFHENRRQVSRRISSSSTSIAKEPAPAACGGVKKPEYDARP